MDTPTTAIAFVRHGQSRGNKDGRFGGHGDTPLTEHGQRQAAAVGAALAEQFSPTAIVASDLLRAQQTAEPIASACDLEIRSDKRFRERSVGIFDGLLFEEAKQQYPEDWKRLIKRDPDFAPPGGEKIDAVFERVSAGVTAVLENHEGGRIVVVSHGLALFHAFAHILGLGSPAAGLKVFALVDNCSVSLFEFAWQHWRIYSINDTSHLRDLDPPD